MNGVGQYRVLSTALQLGYPNLAYEYARVASELGPAKLASLLGNDFRLISDDAGFGVARTVGVIEVIASFPELTWLMGRAKGDVRFMTRSAESNAATVAALGLADDLDGFFQRRLDD